jgi:hypothetical protein
MRGSEQGRTSDDGRPETDHHGRQPDTQDSISASHWAAKRDVGSFALKFYTGEVITISYRTTRRKLQNTIGE